MSSKTPLDSAVSQAVQEIARASAVVCSGASPAEAFSEYVGNGLEDAVGEASDRVAADRAGGSYLVLSFGDTRQRFQIAQTSNLLIPVMDDTVATVMQAEDVPDDERARRKRRDEMAKGGKTTDDFLALGTKIQKAVGAPASTSPYIAKSLAPTPSILSGLPVLITLFSAYWLKRQRRVA